ncbi:MAG: PD40 domain-containing protein [Anaerolineae bacterium]|nr:PD40 domain-containing protein [Anaerolineae bacterium]
MKNRLFIVIVALTLVTLACNPLQSGSSPTIVSASPTPPPIPTRPPLTPTTVSTPEPASEEPSASTGQQTVSLLYGSMRGAQPGLYYLTSDGQFSSSLELGDAHQHTAWPDVSPDGSKIAFVSMTSTLQIIGIFVLDHADDTIFQVTQGDGTNPSWSPDGTRLAYTCNNGTDVCVINIDGTEQANLTADSERMESYPDWTMDGRIVFMSNRDVSDKGRYSELYIMNPDGTGVALLTHDEKAYNANPSVSPDGTRIVYESDRDVANKSEIYIMNIDGSDNVRITTDDSWNQNPVWAPDGHSLLFAMSGGDGNIDLYTINLDGSNKFRLTQNVGEDGGLRLGHTWLPEPIGVENIKREAESSFAISLPTGSGATSNGLLFAANSFNCPSCLEAGIYFVTFDGANLVKLPVSGFYPAWAPDFTRFAFVQNGELYIANADGSSPTQLTHSFLGLSSLDWSDDEKQILANCMPYGQHDACLIDTETGLVRNITEDITHGSGIPYPSWFSSDRILIGAVLLDPLGVQISTVFTPGRASPDGTRYAAILKKQLVIMNPNGSDQNKLTSDPTTKGFPIWSPDGSLVFYSVASGDGHLYLWASRADGANPPYQLVARPIGPGPLERPEVIDTWYGYSWAP